MRRLHATPATQVKVPLQVHAELLVGAAKSANPLQSKARVLSFLGPFEVVWPDAKIEEEYVAIRANLEALGTPISEADLWISATARAAGGTAVTNNFREFSRVPGLLIEDWTAPSS
jgi:tRNA(fMet)-specific endonuclease VapC